MIRSVSISLNWSVSRSGVPNRAFNPRPNAFLCAMYDLLCESDVAFSPFRFDVVEQNRPAVARSFAESNVAGDDGCEYLISEELLQILHDLMREVRSLIE